MYFPPQNSADTVGVVPSSVGALLAEEWTINPYAHLPSFLEMIWINEADQSMHDSLAMGLDYLKEFMEKQLTLTQPITPDDISSHSGEEENENNSHSNTWTDLIDSIRSVKRKGMVVCKNLILRYKHEIVAIITYMVERESLFRTNACVSESMYGGHRVRIVNSPQQPFSSQAASKKLEPLQATGMTRLALIKALVPYLRTKLEQITRQISVSLQGEYNHDNTQSFWRKDVLPAIKKWFVFMYPFLRATVQGMNLICHWQFLMGQSLSFDLPSVLLGQVVRRVTVEDKTPSSGQSQQVESGTAKGGSISTPASATGLSSLQSSLVWGTSLAIVASWATWMRAEWERVYQDQQLCLSSGSSTRPYMSSLIPPPPPPMKRRRGRIEGGKDECPLCHVNPRQSPTACIVSGGYVFCGDCIRKHIRHHKTCPLTGQPCTEDKLVRLYEPRFHQGRADTEFGGENQPP
mmetsp:Transcript_9883/g.20424  ORF Transcript_9883/g.20424 Transcript_9883/m.20424 type:complete len:463 (+) Transcript_9883:126-1514(+)